MIDIKWLKYIAEKSGHSLTDTEAQNALVNKIIDKLKKSDVKMYVNSGGESMVIPNLLCVYQYLFLFSIRHTSAEMAFNLKIDDQPKEADAIDISNVLKYCYYFIGQEEV